MAEIKELLINEAEKLDISFSDVQLRRFEMYYRLLIEWNQKINLTAITEPKNVVIKHFIDSAAVLKYVDIPHGVSLIDVGTGAGFPGVPLKIMRPDIKLTLLDSLNKRLIFLDELLQKLDLDANLIHGRAEDRSHNKEYREKFDFVTSRAVAAMNVLSEYCIPYVKVVGCFIAMKGAECDAEIKQADNAIKQLGGKVEHINKFTLPDDSGRAVIEVKKISKTPDKYPRHGSKIAKSPIL